MNKNKNSNLKIFALIFSLIGTLLGIFILLGNILYDLILARETEFHGKFLEKITTEGNKIFNEKINTLDLEEDFIKYEKTLERAEKNVNIFLDNVNKEDVYQNSFDSLKLRGIKYLSNPKSHKWIIVVHGYLNNSEELGYTYRAYKFSKYDFNVLCVDCRGHGKSEGDYIGMSWHDRKDILTWIDYIISLDKDAEIILHGVSMGGATVMSTTSEKLPPNVKCVIEDCGYTSITEEFKHELTNILNLPYFPFIDAIDFTTKIKAGYSVYDASPIELIKKSTIPIMFIHGGKDDFVPTYMAYELYNMATVEKELLIIENAVHGNSIFVDKEKYINGFLSFANKYLSN